MVSERRIRNRIALATTDKARAAIRADEARNAVADLGAGGEVVRGRRTLRFDRPTRIYRDKDGDDVGVEVWFRTFEGGVEQRVDGHRYVVNPPTLVPDPVLTEQVLDHGRLITRPALNEDPREALLRAIEESIDLAPNPIMWRRQGFAPATVAIVYANSNDTDMQGQDVTYSDVRTGLGAEVYVDSSGVTIWSGQQTGFNIYQSFLTFGSIPGGATVSVATLSLFLDTDGSTTDHTQQWRRYTGTMPPTTYAGDFVKGADFAADDLLATFATAGAGAGYNAFTSDANLLTDAQAGTVTGCLCTDEFANDSAPTNDEYMAWSSSNEAGTTQDPKLTVTYVGTETRFYLSSVDVTPLHSPGFAAWTRTTEGVRRRMAPTASGSAMANKTIWAGGSAAANASALAVQFQSEPLVPGIAFATTDTIKCYIRCLESAINDNINRQPICVKVYNGTTLKATLKALGHIGPTTTEWDTGTAESRSLADGDTLDANYVTTKGDYLVVEVGGQVSSAGGTSVTGTMRFGDTGATDLDESQSDTGDDRPWFEISRACPLDAEYERPYGIRAGRQLRQLLAT